MFSYHFMEYALLAGLLIAIANGIVGSFALLNRMVFLSGAIAHISYGGIGLSLLIGLNIYFGTSIFVFIFTLIISYLFIYHKERLDAYIGIAWALGMSIGVICFSYVHGYSGSLETYMFGSLITITKSSLLIMLIVDIVIILVVGLFYQTLLIVSFDINFAKSRGVNVKLVILMLIILISMTVLISINMVGLILVMSLMSISTYIAESFSKSFLMMVIYSTILNIFFIYSGLLISYYYDVSASGVIIIIATLTFITYFLFKRFKK